MKDEIAVIGLRGFPDVQGGVEKHCEALYPRLTDFRFRVFRRKPYVKDKAAGRYANITFIDLPSTKIKGFEAFIHTLLASFKVVMSRPKLVHVHNIGPGLMIPMLKLFGMRVVMTYHSPNYEHKKWGRAGRMILKFGEWLSLRFSDKIIFVNDIQRGKVASVFMDKTVYIPNGVSHHTPTSGVDYVKSLGLESGRYILGVGRITPEKGFDYLIDAVNRLDEAVTLVIAGGCDNDDAYYRRLRELDKRHRVVFTGNVQGERLRQLYTHAGLFVLSSVNEGFPLVLLEAMDYRLPILVSDIPSTHIPEVKPEDYFTSENVDSLVETLERKLGDKSMPRKDYDLSMYDWDNIADDVRKVYAGLI